MPLAEMIYQHSLKHPERVTREALDFIEFLKLTARARCLSTHPCQNAWVNRVVSGQGALLGCVDIQLASSMTNM